jgi:hypothetical protein
MNTYTPSFLQRGKIFHLAPIKAARYDSRREKDQTVITFYPTQLITQPCYEMYIAIDDTLIIGIHRPEDIAPTPQET